MVIKLLMTSDDDNEEDGDDVTAFYLTNLLIKYR